MTLSPLRPGFQAQARMLRLWPPLMVEMWEERVEAEV